MCRGPSNWCVANAHTHTTKDGGFAQIPYDSPKALFRFSPADKNSSRHLRARVSQDDYRSCFSVSPQQVLPFAFPASSAPQGSSELVGVPGCGGPGAIRVAGRCRGEPRPASAPALPPEGLPRQTCVQVIVVNGKPSGPRWPLPGPRDARAQALPSLEAAEPCHTAGEWGLRAAADGGPRGPGLARRGRPSPAEPSGCVGSAGAGDGRPQPLTGQPRTHRSIPLSLSVARSVTVGQMMHHHNSDRG